MNKISLERLEKEDLCFEDINQENLYDYNTMDDFFEEEIDAIDEVDPVEFQNACDTLVEKCKQLKVFKKDYFRVGAHRIEEYIQDYFDDNYGNSDEYTVFFSEMAENLLKEFLKTVEHDNQVYTTDKCIGYIDLSEEIKEYLNDNYIEDEVNNGI